MRKQRGKFDYNIILVVLLLLVVGLTFIYTASSTKALERFDDDAFFLKRQLLRLLVGALILYVIMRTDYHLVLRISPWVFWLSLTMLIAVLFLPQELAIRGTRRWIQLAGFSFQPSELARLSLILMFARVLSMPGVDMKKFTDGVLPQIILTALVCGLILLEPDTSTGLMTLLIVLGLLFVAGARSAHLFAVSTTALLAAVTALLSVPYQRSRLLSFLHSIWNDSEVSWQVKQSLISLGNGGVFGIGLGQSRQKMHWLPDPFTDFIFSIIGEELGLIGTLGVMALFIYLMFRGFRIAWHAPDREGQLLAAGLTLSLCLYAFMNVAVVTHLVPTTGIPMPFVSYGGSSLIMNLFAIGVLLNISYQGGGRSLKPAKGLKYGKRISRKYSLGL